MAGADEGQVVRCAYGCQDTTCNVGNDAGERGDTSRSVRSYRPHGSLARVLYDKRKADEWLAAYDKRKVSSDVRPSRRRDLRKRRRVKRGATCRAACKRRRRIPRLVSRLYPDRACAFVPRSAPLRSSPPCLSLAARRTSPLGSPSGVTRHIVVWKLRDES